MPVKVKVPKLTENADEVTITAWRRREGESVAKGDPLVEMTTDKAAFDVEAPASGVVRRILAREKSVVPTGYVVALIGAADEALPDVETANARLLAKHAGGRPVPKNEKKDAPAPAPAADGALRATPAARRLAREKGIDLARVKAETGAEVVTEDLVRKYL